MSVANETPIHLVLITGMSGSGKSVALTALEDVGFYCVDNLPPELLESFIELEQSHKASKVAIAMDVRSAGSLPGLPKRLAQLQHHAQRPVHLTTVFLDATTDTLVRRFSETRRLHPLSLKQFNDQHRALTDAIEQERDLLAELRDQALVLDTSLIRPTHLRSQIKDLLGATQAPLTLVFESFAFKRGIPMDADFVFDVRMLANPHYEPHLKPLTGRDAAVAAYLEAQPEVQQMERQITDFLAHWLPQMLRDHRSYVTVAIGCTGGQHRSVYLVEQLARVFGADWSTRVRHREADSWPTPMVPGV
ncbi:RNase adapter RapZ [Hydrogenophaga sp.]|uniref:RNase adapter RapZ n=1 Tax=Hydrogenophaga sp. TaxID=1904254 RepID=UPI0027304F33|nr:RNase adapter RapZ [Hydrogenophaga sp.]MDP2075457.1 RNase adapter RapZ [Hydrogenophaga sp.]MDP2985955.1 RNase adapter RapZ [Hydrogenophaga sp.]MDP3109023.1 RNase adapter RapZ [Hydrogenophaga sp.]MDZ4282771.1 RNase adapter RapZ [Hydrogenophaga sp.]